MAHITRGNRPASQPLKKGSLNGPQLWPAILSIDFGSTFTRVVLRCRGDKLVHGRKTVTVAPPSETFRGEEYIGYHGYRQYASYANPFYPDWKNRIGIKAFHDPSGCSLKYYFYFLALDNSEQVEQILREYPHFKALMDYKDEPGFKEKLQESLEIFFSDIIRNVADHCSYFELVVDQIILSIPPQFTKRFQDIFTAIIMKVSSSTALITAGPADVYYITEGEALTHFLVAQRLSQFQGDPILLVIDIGGHCMNGCLCVMRCIEDDIRNADIFTGALHFEIKAPFSTLGGSELWTYLVGQHIKSTLEIQVGRGDKFPNDAWVKMIKEFIAGKRAFGPNQEAIFSARLDKGRYVDAKITKKKMTLLHEAAFQKPLQLAKAEIKAASEKYGKNRLCVVLSGGSLLNEALAAQLEAFTKEHADTLLWTAKLPSDQTFSIVDGAAISLVRRLTVEQFLTRGAAFGIQDGTIDGEKWNEEAEPLYYYQANYYDPEASVITFPLDRCARGLRAKLICDPFYRLRQEARLHFDQCYDVYDLGAFKPGEYEFFVTENDNQLVVQVMAKFPDGATQQEHIVLPLYFNGASNCVLVDEDKLSATGGNSTLANVSGQELAILTAQVQAAQQAEAAQEAGLLAGNPDQHVPAARQLKKTYDYDDANDEDYQTDGSAGDDSDDDYDAEAN